MKGMILNNFEDIEHFKIKIQELKLYQSDLNYINTQCVCVGGTGVGGGRAG